MTASKCALVFMTSNCARHPELTVHAYLYSGWWREKRPTICATLRRRPGLEAMLKLEALDNIGCNAVSGLDRGPQEYAAVAHHMPN
jgi:hypothetical protein